MDNVECSPMISTYLTHAFKDKLSLMEQRPSGTGFLFQELQVSFFFFFFFELQVPPFWEESPSGLRHYIQNCKVPGSVPTNHSTGLWDRTSLRDPW